VEAGRLAQLNADSTACIARWNIRVEQNEALGRFLVSGTGVPAGETVMVLPPNLIQAFEEVLDYNTVIQVSAAARSATPGRGAPLLTRLVLAGGTALRRQSPQPRRELFACAAVTCPNPPPVQVRYSEHQSERLYSASLTADDLDNFLSHRRGLGARAPWQRVP